MSTEVVVAAPPMTIASLRERAQHVQALIKDLMVENVHYQVIPGTSERSITKQGTEMLLSAFHIAIEPEIIENHDADAVRYTVKARGVHMGTGAVIGVGVGRCSSNEEKYKWRAAVCPAEYDAAPEDRRRIKWGHGKGGGHYTVQQIRTNPEDMGNTVLKMAKKRAQADLCLTALAASDAFKTQRRPPNPTPPATTVRDAARARPEPSQAAGETKTPSGATNGPPGATNAPRPATSAQLGLIRQKLDRAGIAETYFFEQFEVLRFEDITFDQVNRALAWIADLDRAPPA